MWPQKTGNYTRLEKYRRLRYFQVGPFFYGKVFKNLDEVRQAVLEFHGNYNRYWRLDKLGFKTPLDARQRYENEQLQPLAA